MTTDELPFWDAVDRLRERDPRYRREAYGFVVAALGWTVESLPAERRRDPVRRHLSGAELLQGLAALALQEFGPMAGTVFQEWGVRSGEDVGRIVFQLVECHQLSQRPEDRIEDFRGFDLAASLVGEPAGGPTRPGVSEGGASRKPGPGPA